MAEAGASPVTARPVPSLVAKKSSNGKRPLP
jgi:hypothetical protein